ncbi:MAG TPA: SRPBCC family protein [Flavipsychrobacter sp.]|nr:SRPBCC family protein [Flavipsychrobacter sp.]
MKVLRILGIIVLILIAGLLIMGLVAPKDITAERSVTISAPHDMVADQMYHFANFKQWSPWQELDPDMKTEITGEDGKNATYSWVGNDKAGAGKMTMDNVMDVTAGNGKPMHSANITIKFIKPFEGDAKSNWKVEDLGNGESKATWSFTTHHGFPMNGLMMLMGMKGMLEKDFDKGLNKLKTYIETNKGSFTAPDAAAANFDIKETRFAGGTYASIRKTVSFNDMDKFFSNSFESIGKAAGSRINGKGVGIYYNWDEAKGNADVAAAFSITGTEPVAGAQITTIPASAAYLLVYKGGYAGSYAAHQALMKEIAAKGKKQELCVEEYVVNPGDTKDTNMYVTNIYYLVK